MARRVRRVGQGRARRRRRRRRRRQRRTWSTVLLQPTNVRPRDSTTVMFAHHSCRSEFLATSDAFGSKKITFAGSGCSCVVRLVQLTFTSVLPDRHMGAPQFKSSHVCRSASMTLNDVGSCDSGATSVRTACCDAACDASSRHATATSPSSIKHNDHTARRRRRWSRTRRPTDLALRRRLGIKAKEIAFGYDNDLRLKPFPPAPPRRAPAEPFQLSWR
eukprot:COSAG06_NODE_874_length_11831_cov_217.383396_4_plen_218_part_00